MLHKSMDKKDEHPPSPRHRTRQTNFPYPNQLLPIISMPQDSLAAVILTRWMRLASDHGPHVSR
jgi:hypothetical protein